MLVSEPNIEKLISHLSHDNLNVLLIAEKSEINMDQLIRKSNVLGFRVAGGIFPMVIHEDKYVDEGVIVKHLSLHSNSYVIPVGEDDIIEKLPDLRNEVNSCILFLDGLMQDIPEFLEGLYEKYWNNIDFFGAGCGSLSLKQTPCVFSNDGVFQNAALMIGISQKMQLGVKHGWEKIAGPIVANKTDKNRIVELNWRPAFEVYKEIVEEHSGRSFDEEEFFDISKGYPFGIFREGKEDIVRDPIVVDEKGIITCVGEVNENVSLNILHGNKENLINCAGEATRLAFDGVKPNDFLVVDCISRVLYLDNDFSQELQSVKKSLGSDQVGMKLSGVLSLGEISSVKGGFLEFYNKTIVVSSFYS